MTDLLLTLAALALLAWIVLLAFVRPRKPFERRRHARPDGQPDRRVHQVTPCEHYRRADDMPSV